MVLKWSLKLKAALHIFSLIEGRFYRHKGVSPHLSNAVGVLPFSLATAVPDSLWTLLILDQ